MAKLLSFSILLLGLFTSQTASQVWPDPSNLIGLWPLSSQYKLDSVVGNGMFQSNTNFDSRSLVHGPYGTQDTAMRSLSENQPLLDVRNTNISTYEDSFTVAFYLQTSSDISSGGIFQFIDGYYDSSSKSLQIAYLNEKIIVSASTKVIGEYKIIQRKSAWTFVALVFNAETGELSVYSEHGLAYAPKTQPYLEVSNIFNNAGFKLGFSSAVNTGMSSNDAVSCLSLYSTNLDGDQLKQLQLACRLLHGSAMAGTPKVPLTPLPAISSPPLTTVPSEGQFPWLGILETDDGTLVCTVSILDEYWVLTSANCFDPKNSNDYVYQVKVGLHDRSLNSPWTKIHQVDEIIRSGSTERDIAMIQLVTPIDFRSAYVNDAALFNGDPGTIEIHEPQFVSGWGINGRNVFVSPTLPRFITGTSLSISYCSQAWNGTFDPYLEHCFMSLTLDRNVPCTGDEGTPLMYQGVPDDEMNIDVRLIQVGIYYGRGDSCSRVTPGLFVNIDQYIDWINEQMACAIPGSSHKPVKCPQ